MAKKANIKPTAAPATPLSATFQVPLSALEISEHNVRSADTVSQEGIVEMASMLLSAGQMQPLLVVRNGDKYSVCAGGRRTRGFWHLRDQGIDGQTIPADHPVDVREILNPDDAKNLSLVENLSQEPMHPADEYVAFQRLADAGKSADDIAKAYGISPVQVKRRMKLANVHPDVSVRRTHVDRSRRSCLKIRYQWAASDAARVHRCGWPCAWAVA